MQYDEVDHLVLGHTHLLIELAVYRSYISWTQRKGEQD